MNKPWQQRLVWKSLHADSFSAELAFFVVIFLIAFRSRMMEPHWKIVEAEYRREGIADGESEDGGRGFGSR